jgi:GT2 family glycosyltransferase
MLPPNKKVLIIVVTYNGINWLEKLFKSVDESSIKADMFFVDNGSTDGTQELIKAHNVTKFVQSAENLGFGAANNVGIKYAIDEGYDYVYLLNQDAWLFPNTLESLIGIHKRNPEYGILSPFQIQANEQYLDKNFVAGVCAYNSNKDLFNDLYFGRIQELYSVPDVMAAHWLISRQCFLNVGGFSPTFPHYGEDNNYASRTIFHGFKIGICPNVKAVHDREFRVETKKKKIYMQYISSLIMLSDVCERYKHAFLRAVYILLKGVAVQQSFRPLLYLMRIIKEYPSIKRNRKLSMIKGTRFLSGKLN